MEQLMTRREVLRVLRVADPKTLARWIAAENFPPGIGVGRRALWDPAVVRDWIARQNNVTAA